ncbi:peptide/nickel transport system permease protein [Geosporobacter subterraneus DSM 17957]|uniref:Nickel import system permease protein NikB n=1 Tax=Geosporobacter subterraneus DSM 17957 TaxID=1121919 RepID=A0A1M6QAE2_9FIRM|nr:nickel ABC transporter permease [Geosporobacter subterraneus]SHK17067.1 peptide/nickel transport system permease protein [Geosporobacter subterraneus DSM 17957]
MKYYLLKRIVQLMVVMLLATFLTFGLTYISPSDPAEMMLTSRDVIPTEELLEKTREEMGLKDPFILQYGNWLKRLLRGDLGYSYSKRESVAEVLPQRIFMTTRLALAALLILVVFSLGLGILSAIQKSKLADYIIRGFSFVGISIPSFWLGLILIYIFVVKNRWFRITDPYAHKSIILPAMTLAIPLIGRYVRQIRAAILEQYSQDYVVGARARGIREGEIIIHHILPNALLGIITLIGLSTAALLGGTVIVENIFTWPGLGSMALEAITYRDYPLLQAYVIFMVWIYVSINFIVDIMTQALDPRVVIRGGRIGE